MRVLPVDGLASGERALAAAPAPATHVDAGWNRRLNLQPGRALTEGLLEIEQQHRERHLARLGARLSPGIVEGLALAVERRPGPGGEVETVVCGMGRGLAASGQDLALRLPLAVPLDQLPRLAADGRVRRFVEPETPEEPPRGLGVVVLVPLTVEQERFASEAARERAFRDPCPVDPDALAFADLRLYDGALLTFYSWPEGWPDFAGTGERRRNLLAFEVFRRAAAAGETRLPLPWSAAGMALALVDVDAEGRIAMLDRAAVARRGGAAPPRPALSLRPDGPDLATLLATRGTPFLWQARLEQLMAQAAELARTGASFADATAHFAHLPPIGVLPKQAFADGQGFFPPAWRRLSVPIPIEQLELALEPAAGLAPFDLAVPDTVLWLIPVPQALFEPRLLLDETVAQEFLDRVDALVLELAKERFVRARLRDMADVVARAVDPAFWNELENGWKSDDPVPGEDEIPDPAPDQQPAIVAHHEKALPRLKTFFETDLAAGLKAALSAAELDAIDPGGAADGIDNADFAGLQPFTEGLARRVGMAEDTINLGFTRLQAEIYRVRQILLDSEESTRLATSPVLAGVVKEATSAFAANLGIRSYFTAKRAVELRPAAATATSPVALGAFQPTFKPGTIGVAPIIGLRPTAPIDVDLGRAITERRTEVADRFVALDPGQLRTSIGQKLAIPGEFKDFRTLTIADRLKVSAATEAKSGAVRLKADIVAQVQALKISLENLQAPIAPRGMSLLPREGYESFVAKLRDILLQGDHPEVADKWLADRAQRVSGGPDDPQALFLVDLSPLSAEEANEVHPETVRAVEQLFADFPAGFPILANEDLPGIILSGVLDPDPADGDEAAFLSRAIAILEGTVALLRVVEGRVELLKMVLERAQKALAEIGLVADAWEDDLARADRALAERRHDLVVGRSLLAEEEARIAAINARRKEVREQHVPFVAFMRPRTTSALAGRDLPWREAIVIDAETEPPCPRGLEAPPELDALLATLREVPIGWLKDLAPLVAALDRPKLLPEIYTSAVLRAKLVLEKQQLVAAPPPPVQKAPLSFLAASQLVGAYDQVKLEFARTRLALDPKLVLVLGAKEGRERAARELSLADLEASGRIKPEQLRIANERLARIEDVATCLLRRIDDVPVAIRLSWVERISVFDATVDLSRLDRLPGWQSVEFERRRELMRLVGWLFDRVAPDAAQARALIGDIVRVAILLASHAPVAALVQGRVETTRTGRVGDVIEVAIDKGAPKLGGKVAFFEGANVRVRGIVEDLAQGKALIRVVEARTPIFELAKGVKAQFMVDAQRLR